MRDSNGVDVVLIESGLFVSAVAKSGQVVSAKFDYRITQLADGTDMTGFPIGGLSSRLDQLEADGYSCAVVDGESGSALGRRVIYVTGDPRGAPHRLTAAEAIGLAATSMESAPTQAISSGLSLDADRLLDMRVEFLLATWSDYLKTGEQGLLLGLRDADALGRHAQRIAKRPRRARRNGDEAWTGEMDVVLETMFARGRQPSEIARAIDRPIGLTTQRLEALGYPGTLWPAWTKEADGQLAALVHSKTELAETAMALRRSPWDIIKRLSEVPSTKGMPDGAVADAPLHHGQDFLDESHPWVSRGAP